MNHLNCSVVWRRCENVSVLSHRFGSNFGTYGNTKSLSMLQRGKHFDSEHCNIERRQPYNVKETQEDSSVKHIY